MNDKPKDEMLLLTARKHELQQSWRLRGWLWECLAGLLEREELPHGDVPWLLSDLSKEERTLSSLLRGIDLPTWRKASLPQKKTWAYHWAANAYKEGMLFGVAAEFYFKAGQNAEKTKDDVPRRAGTMYEQACLCAIKAMAGEGEIYRGTQEIARDVFEKALPSMITCYESIKNKESRYFRVELGTENIKQALKKMGLDKMFP